MNQIDDLLAAAKNGNHLEVERLILGLSPEEIERSDALREAAKNGHAQCVKLLGNKHYTQDIFKVLEEVRHGDLACVMKLIRSIDDANTQHTNALYYATQQGNAGMVEFLIPLCDPSAQHSLALRHAAESGYTECLKLLIPVSDPKANNNQALRSALLKQHMDCANMLYPVSDTQAILESLEHIMNAPHPKSFDVQILAAQQILNAMIEKERLQLSIDGLNQHSSHSRKL